MALGKEGKRYCLRNNETRGAGRHRQLMFRERNFVFLPSDDEEVSSATLTRMSSSDLADKLTIKSFIGGLSKLAVSGSQNDRSPLQVLFL